MSRKLWEQNIHDTFHKNRPLDPLLNHVNPAHTFTPATLTFSLFLFCRLRLGLPIKLCPSCFSRQNPRWMYLLFSREFCMSSPAHPVCSYHLTVTWLSSYCYLAIILQLLGYHLTVTWLSSYSYLAVILLLLGYHLTVTWLSPYCYLAVILLLLNYHLTVTWLSS
jgi:hypothetical protein